MAYLKHYIGVDGQNVQDGQGFVKGIVVFPLIYIIINFKLLKLYLFFKLVRVSFVFLEFFLYVTHKGRLYY